MIVKHVHPDLLTEWHLNPKQHPREQIEHIENSLQDFGWLEAILVDEDYRVLAGHGRLKAAKKADLQEVPVIVVAGWSEADKAGFTVFDNESVKMTGLDGTKLEECYALVGTTEEALERYGLGIEKLGSDGNREYDADKTGDALDTFLNNEIKQITMYFAPEEYRQMVELIDKIIAANPNCTNRSEVFKLLLDTHEAEQHG